ncbi:type II toxin-antitoxin system HipA family toxin [Opitutaceae bacterium TAV4]|nr:type II toxin-antitoxin system HipA family toxin [Opitutaceae bacterium TAV4]RRK00159.1 type II toxin-antitoxin system HipA family toxin [Opitutaceae bacterium TAV3]
MKRTIQVYLGDEQHRVGTLHYDVNGPRERAAFAYDPAWLESSDRFSLEPGLPLVSGAQFHRKTKAGSVFHAVIADTEPDGWARRVILRDHAKRRQEARRAGQASKPGHFNAMDFLLAVDDSSRVGALRFKDEAGVFCRAAEAGRRTTPPLVELSRLLTATRAVETENETAADLAYLRGRGTSLGGMRPKCTVVDEDGCLAIGKFPSVHDERPVTKGEVLAMQLAQAAGIHAADTRLVASGGLPVALIKRFDRPQGGGRLMYVSAATMVGAEPDDSQDHFYTEIVDALRIHGAAAQDDIDELWRRMAYSILITNVDDHLRNHGFLHFNRGLWRLAPAFDLNPFPDRVRELKTWISEESGPEATIDALLSVIAYFRIPLRRAKTILGEVERAVSGWREKGSALGMTERELDQFDEAFEHPEREAARRTSA